MYCIARTSTSQRVVTRSFVSEAATESAAVSIEFVSSITNTTSHSANRLKLRRDSLPVVRVVSTPSGTANTEGPAADSAECPSLCGN